MSAPLPPADGTREANSGPRPTESDRWGWERLATNLRVERKLLEALDVLSDLPVVVFKGALLTRQIYGDLRQRASADNDIWVRAGQAGEALRRLQERDFRALPGLDASRALSRVGQVALFEHGELSEVSLDLHAEPFSARYFDVQEKDLVPHLVTLRIHDRPVTTFDRPLALVHMVAHWVQHHLEESHLTSIRDAWDSWGHQLDYGELSQLARRTCTQEALEAALTLAHPRRALPRGGALHVRSKIAITGIGDDFVTQYRPLRKLLSLLLVAPKKVPLGVWRAAFLEQDDLNSRYGPGRRVRLLMRHLWRSLER